MKNGTTRASELLAGGLHDFSRYEKREPAKVYACEPATPTCDICAAFGQQACRQHQVRCEEVSDSDAGRDRCGRAAGHSGRHCFNFKVQP